MNIFSTHRKLLSLLLIVVLLVAIPLTLYVVKQQQELRQRAATSQQGGTSDTCHLFGISVAESPVCPNIASVKNGQIIPQPGKTNNVSTYSTTYTITNKTNQPHTVTYERQSYFCTQPYGVASGDGKNEWTQCVDSPKIVTETATVQPGQSLPITITRSSDTGTVCGTFQTDFAIRSIDGNSSCNYTSSVTVGASGGCQTGITCPVAQAQPTPTPTTPAPTVPPAVAPPPTATVAPKPTATIAPRPTATTAPLPTPTEAPAPTSTPADTPVPTEIALAPTLTPTPEAVQTNTVVNPTPTEIPGLSPTPSLAPTGDTTPATIFGLGAGILVLVGAALIFLL